MLKYFSIHRTNIFLVTVLINIVGLGFGFKPLFLISVLSLFSFLVVRSLFEKDYVCSIIITSLLFASIIEPAGFQSLTIIAFALFITKYFNLSCALILSHFILSISIYTPTPAYLLSPYFSSFLFIIGCIFLKNFNLQQLSKVLYPIYSTFVILSLFTTFDLPAIKDSKIGTTAQHIINQPTNASSVFKMNSSFNAPLKDETVYYFEHGTANGSLILGDYRQPQPWTWQQIVAPEPLRFAIEKDSYLILNWGAYFNLSSHSPILSFIDKGRVVPLALNNNGFILLADSDFMADTLSAYQIHLIQRLSGVDKTFQYSYLLFLCLFALLPWMPSKKEVWMEIMICLTFLFILFFEAFIPKSGDVRFCGRNKSWPHTDLGFGVVRKLNEQAITSTFGDKDAWIVVVENGYSTSYDGERLVILEPNAKIEINGEIITAGVFPLGTIESIRDAREIITPKKRFKGMCKIGEAVIIATGSPANINYKELLEYEK